VHLGRDLEDTLEVVDCRVVVEPGLSLFWKDDEWHPVVDRREFFCCLSGHDRATRDRPPILTPPAVPDPGEGQGPAVSCPDGERLVAGASLSPFIEA